MKKDYKKLELDKILDLLSQTHTVMYAGNA